MSKQPNWLLIPTEIKGYSYGVEAYSGNPWVELHGGFKTPEEADAHRRALLREFGGYTNAKVVRIETPEVAVPGSRERTISVDRLQLNTELTEMLAGFGWEADDDYLNDLTHTIADDIEEHV